MSQMSQSRFFLAADDTERIKQHESFWGPVLVDDEQYYITDWQPYCQTEVSEVKEDTVTKLMKRQHRRAREWTRQRHFTSDEQIVEEVIAISMAL